MKNKGKTYMQNERRKSLEAVTHTHTHTVLLVEMKEK